ncbi:hypothetical protein RB593_002276 [Gaeumannomyces tritici]
MDAAVEARGGAASPSGARPPSMSSRRSSVSVAAAAADEPAHAASPQDVSGDESGPQSWHRDSQDVESGAASVKSGEADLKADGSGELTNGSDPAPSAPVQKRRRVTRACDEVSSARRHARLPSQKLERKRLTSPCTHCSVYSYECTYDKPSNRRRNPGPQYVDALEQRLQRAEALLRKFIPDVDLADPNLDRSVQLEFTNRARAQASRMKGGDTGGVGKSQEDQLMSMIESIGHLDLADGESDFHGTSSGAVFMRRLKAHMGIHNDAKPPFPPRRPRQPFAFDSPQSTASSPFDPGEGVGPAIYDLPPKEVSRSLCYFSLNCATCLLRIVHLPTFYESFERLYDKKSTESLGLEDYRDLALLYSTLALGSVFFPTDDEIDPDNQVHYKGATEKGFKFYTLARFLLQDITDCHNLVSLQALYFMILYLQATSNISGCYALLGIALRSAVRMGLHRHLPHAQLNPFEDEMRRRVFYAIRQLDIYVSALMGFPVLLKASDIDQPLPTEVDDEFITKDAIIPPPPGTPSFFQATNAHVRLMDLLDRVVQEVYPLKAVEESGKGDQVTSFTIRYSTIKAIEAELQQWYEQLPIAWRPSPEGPIEVIRVRSLLRFSYAHVQMMLYRPFLHYASPRLSAGKHVDERYYACAAACISVSRNLIHIGIEIKRQGVLIGPYWVILYTQYFAILSLLFYALENPDKPGTAEILADAHAGKELVASLSNRSLAADRVTEALSALFEQLPDRLRNPGDQARAHVLATKKRAAPGGVSASSPSSIKDQPGGGGGGDKKRSESIVRTHSGRSQGSARAAAAAAGSRPASVAQQQQQHRIPLDAATAAAVQHARAAAAGGPAHGFMSSFGDPVPLDVLMASSQSPDPGAGGFRRPPEQGAFGQVSQHQHNQQQQRQASTSGSGDMYKLDAMMFPTTDPFAYPARIAMAHHHHRDASVPGGGGGGGGNVATGQGQEQADGGGMCYYEIEGQLIGSMPQYLVQPGAMGGPAVLDDLAAQMYGMAPSHMAPPHHRQHHHHPHQDDMDDILLTDPSSFDFLAQQYRRL